MDMYQHHAEAVFFPVAVADEAVIDGELCRIEWTPARGWDSHRVAAENGRVIADRLRLSEARELLQSVSARENRRDAAV